MTLWTDVDRPTDLCQASRVEVLQAAVETSLATGRSTQGIDYASQALSQLDPKTDPHPTARLLGLRGLLLNRSGSTGVDDLVRAVDLTEDGTDPTPHSLAARDLADLRVAARGPSNAEVAGELFISPNTVATNMISIL